MEQQREAPAKRGRKYYQEIGRKGGRATVERYGREHMRYIGKRGFEVTTDRHFQGQRAAHLSWLRSAGLHAYWSATGLKMKYDADGRAIWPEFTLPHPAHNDGLPF